LNLDFEASGNVRLTSLLDLIGATAQVVQRGVVTAVTVTSPFAEDPNSMQSYLPQLLENLTTIASPSIPGRININQAPRELLMGIPNMDGILLEQIISYRDIQVGINKPEQTLETWLLGQGFIDLAKMKQLMPLITTGGDVYRARVVGYFDSGGPISRLEVIIDASQSPPAVRRRWELDELGQDTAYSVENLGGAPDAAPATPSVQ
jgi:DNA uptake protein ComE-like DNA-binding protein